MSKWSNWVETVSAGEFGTMMSEIFEAGKPGAVLLGSLGYSARPPQLRFCLRYRAAIFQVSYFGDRHQAEIVPAYRGLIYIDRDTKAVTKITLNPYDIPADFPIREPTNHWITISRPSATRNICCR